MQKVQHVELAWTEIPTVEEKPAGIPERFGGAQQLEQSLIASAGSCGFLAHAGMFTNRLLMCQLRSLDHDCVVLDQPQRFSRRERWNYFEVSRSRRAAAGLRHSRGP